MVWEEEGTGNGGVEKGKLTDKLDKLIDMMEDKETKKKEKKIKFPKVSIRKLKKNYLIVFLLKTNRQIEPKVLKIEDGMVYLKDNETFHLATTDYIYRYKNYPAVILPEWDLKPISFDELMGKAIDEKRLALPQKIIIQAMKQAQLQQKKKGSNVIWIILIVIAVVAGGYFLLNRKKAG